MKRREAGIDVRLITQVKHRQKMLQPGESNVSKNKSYKTDRKAYSEGGVRGDESTRLLLEANN